MRARLVGKWPVLSGLAGLLLVCALLGLSAYRHRSSRGLPYHDSFLNGKADEWEALGGTWELADGSMRNDSDERGAKLMTGSSQWTDYLIEADVMLLGRDGDAGLVVRSSEEEEGVDAYTGYYAGLRIWDNSLVIGRAGYGWAEMNEPLSLDHMTVHSLHWYHIKLLAKGCHILATAKDVEQNKEGAIAVVDGACIQKGRAGLRSYGSGGVWRNVAIRPASQADLSAMLPFASRRNPSSEHTAPADDQSFWRVLSPHADNVWQGEAPISSARSISSLRLLSPAERMRATVRGAVVLASPSLFIQDATGGVAVEGAAGRLLKVGDEVEVTGSVRATAFSSTFEKASVRVLWENTPTPPLAVTASQVATGAYDATFVEAQGLLTEKERRKDDSLVLSLDEGPQSFQAVLNRGRGSTLYDTLKSGSTLRLRGIAVADGAYTRDLVPFVLLLRSSDDVVVVAGPPWWNARHVAWLATAALLLCIAANYLYHRVQSWRLRAVIEEREHIAYEMHDTLSQSFAGIGFQLKAIREGLPKESPWLHEQLDLASELVRQSHKEARRSIAVLRPDQSVSNDLMGALRECANQLVAGGSVRVIATCVGTPVKAPLRVTDTLYHIGQEALANAVQHAHATALRIQLTYHRETVELSIQDDGGGFAQNDEVTGFGLPSMRKRAANIGATMHVRSAPGEGTEIRVRSGLRARKTDAVAAGHCQAMR